MEAVERSGAEDGWKNEGRGKVKGLGHRLGSSGQLIVDV